MASAQGGGGLFDKVYFGGGFGFNFSQDFASFNVTPFAAYKITDRWSAGIGANYQSRMVVLSGSLDIGTAGVWQTLSSNRTYGVSQTGTGISTFEGRLEIRDTATLTIQDTANIYT